MPINPNVAFNSLMNGVEAFLKKYPVRIFGDVNASGVAQYAMENRGNSFRPGSILGTLNLHATESFNIRATAAGIHGPGSHVFNAHSIHMDVGIGAMGFYRLGAAGPAIVVTGQLSGCAFVISPAGGNDLDVAHIQPVGAGVTGANLATTLKTNHPNAFVYGATAGRGFYDNGDRVVSIIGVRGGGGAWRIYAQKHDRNSGDYTIRSVYRIHPNHTKL
jgi:hypothetical protein